MKFGAFRGFRDAVWLYLFEAKKAAEFSAPPAETFVYVWAPYPSDPRHRFNRYPCARIIGNALHDAATEATFPIVHAGASAIVYAAGGSTSLAHRRNLFLQRQRRRGDARRCGIRRHRPVWDDSAVAHGSGRENAEVIRMADQFLPVLAGDGDTSAVCAWLRSRPETPPGVLNAVAALEEELPKQGVDND
jgi:hypothetical protein